MMRAGRLDRHITIQRQNPSQLESGQQVENWQTVACVWAQVVYGRGSERFAAQQMIGKAVVTFRIRWSPEVSEISVLHSILYDGRRFDITDMREIGRHEGIEIDATARSEEPLSDR
ncbi:phage head closure protein [Rhodoligotrophos defluvii]|uniref:phage head closure protein n=1 Tax=Rhodoligotrophos defluvii TaxID=2561934 RepID=UPI0010CA1ADA|nr:phage head closure protein [Rhodoligotrophos defluvii]